MTYILTCNDVIQSFERADIKVTAETLEEAFDLAARKFARKYKTKKEYVDITAIHRCENGK